MSQSGQFLLNSRNASLGQADLSDNADQFGADTLVVIEKWESMDHLKAHGASDHMKAYGAKNKDLVANRAVHVLQNA